MSVFRSNSENADLLVTSKIPCDGVGFEEVRWWKKAPGVGGKLFPHYPTSALGAPHVICVFDSFLFAPQQ